VLNLSLKFKYYIYHNINYKTSAFLNENGVQIFSSNYTLYGDMSARVTETLYHLAPEIEIYSIDEAF